MNKRSFWTNAAGFSIVDVLAISYSGTYLMLILCNIYFQNVRLTDLLETMSPTVLIILGGYFTGQTVQQFNLTRKNRNDAMEENREKYHVPPAMVNEPYYFGDNLGTDRQQSERHFNTNNSNEDYTDYSKML